MVKCLRSAWGMIIEMEPTAHLSYSNPKQPDVAAANIGRGHRRLVADLKLTSSLASTGKDTAGDGELGWKGAYVRFGNTETGLLKLVKGRGKWSPSGATAATVLRGSRIAIYVCLILRLSEALERRFAAP